MLFELTDNHSQLKPVAFCGIAEIGGLEKDLEILLSKSLFETLFGQTPLLPFHQEAPLQPVGDIYALNQDGDVVIFELKRAEADSSALDQVLRYAQKASSWAYNEIQRKHLAYTKGGGTETSSETDLDEVHRSAFGLEKALSKDQFNQRQHMCIVGSAADDQLIRGVDYWKSKGLSIDFFPYRIYRLNSKLYFEFFAKPYDRHVNLGRVKGVLFNTNRRWDYLEGGAGYGCLRDMLSKRRVAAYGGSKEAVLCFQRGDYVFYYHNGRGVVGAAKVKGNNAKTISHEEYDKEMYWDVDLLTREPSDYANIPAMAVADVKGLLARGFFLARIAAVPYLDAQESEQLLQALYEVIPQRASSS